MRAFAGIILKIPTMPAVERLAKDMQIADTLSNSPTTATVRQLASLHGVPMRSIAKSFSKHTGEGLKNARLRESR